MFSKEVTLFIDRPTNFWVEVYMSKQNDMKIIAIVLDADATTQSTKSKHAAEEYVIKLNPDWA